MFLKYFKNNNTGKVNAMEYIRRSTSILLVLFLCKTTTIKYPRDELLLLCEDLRISYVKIYRFIDWSSHKENFIVPLLS